MASQDPEGVVVEVVSSQPIPSAEKTVVENGINGTNGAISPSNPYNPPSNHLEINGKANLDAHSANSLVPASNLPAEITTVVPIQTDSNLEPSDAKQRSTPADPPDVISDSFDPLKSALGSALDATTSASAVPPVVEAPESDIRDTSPHTAPEIAGEAPITVNGSGDAQVDTFEQTDSGITPTAAELSIGDDTALSVQSKPDMSAPVETLNNESPMSTNLEATQPTATTVNGDTSMTDLSPDTPSAPPSSTKIAREREDDDDVDGPAAKRVKTEGPLSSEDTGRAILAVDEKESIKILKNATRTKDGAHFAQPVVKAWPSLAEGYSRLVSNPMDFGTMETKLREHQYATFNDLLADLDLVYENCVIYNGATHAVTKSAANVRKSIQAKLSNHLSGANIKPQPKARSATPKSDTEKKPRRTRPAAPVTAPAPAQTHVAKAESQSAPVRRDSLAEDRPKRQRHPAKSKDLIYDSVPKTGKAAVEMRFCESVLAELNNPKHHALAHFFLHPVDTVALHIPQYHQIVKQPMDLGTIAKKLEQGRYNNAKEFESDFRLIIKNCATFNGVDHPVTTSAKKFEAVFDAEWKKKKSFMDKQIAKAASPAPEEDSEEEQSDEDEPEATPTAEIEKVNQRVIAEQEKLIHMMSGGKKFSEFDIEIQRKVVEAVKKMQDQGAASAKPKGSKPKKDKNPRKSSGVRKSVGGTATPAAPRRKSTGKKKSTPHMSQLDKEVISNGLSSLPEEQGDLVMQMIKNDRPDLAANDDGTLELDIESISQPVLWDLLKLVDKHTPEVRRGLEKALSDREPVRAPPAKQATNKKHKPMGKKQQEHNLALLEGKLQEIDRASPSSPISQEVNPSTAPEAVSSGDEESDSEED